MALTLEKARLLGVRRSNVHLEAVFAGTEVIVKMILSGRQRWSNTESLMYRHITETLRRLNITPHVVPCLGTWRCTLEHLPDVTRELVASGLDDKTRQEHDLSKPLEIIVLEKVQNRTLFTFLHASPDLRDLLCILYQLLYTLDCFARIGLKHGDLHPSNILIQRFPAEEVRIYHNDPRSKATNHVTLRTRVHAQIIDLESAELWAQDMQDLSDKSRDVYMLISRLYKYTDSTKVGKILRPWFEQVADIVWIEEQLAKESRSGADRPIKTARECLKILTSMDWPDSPFTVTAGKAMASGGYCPIDLP